MLFDHDDPHAFRARQVAPSLADEAAREATAAVERRALRRTGLKAYAVHLARDRTRVVTVEAWANAACYCQDLDAKLPGSGLYGWAATGGTDPTPVEDCRLGEIVIDLFSVWRPLVRAVSAFNIRNGEAFNREPGCISTTVLRGLTNGGIATYARWRSSADFAAAFAKLTGKPAHTPDDVNRAAARMTLGLIRPDYHAYDLVAFEGEV